MIMGKVVNRLIATRKYDELQGYKFLVIEPSYGDKKDYIIAADTLGAGEGEVVLVSFGHAIQYALDKNAPIDALVVGIVDDEPILKNID